ncbi:major capsid protein [Kineothrix sp. MB12-C1]|uniref:major capsid protein n=1 Tax=Kineothrix sp. MB12-C1 TaxID=3070215 RepID=UPI0027D24185|nr:phage capsid protein [Kineothrix sp. MB12-C1]WMC91255.1 phage capsid protein [Kineothrix sp. MB12-C1]
MAITLAEAKVGMADKVNQNVVDEFRRDSFLLDKLIFDDAVSPGTGGSTLTYGYVQLQTPSTAERRDINTEYENNEAKRVKKTADLDIFGGSFKIDRVLQNTSGAIDEIDFQMKQKIKAASNLFHYLVVNGSTSNSNGFKKCNFDGIRKLLSGSSTEKSAEAIDLTTVEMIDKYMFSFVLMINKWLQGLGDKPDMLLMNGDMIAIMQYIGQKMGYYERTKDDFGRDVTTYKGIPMLDAGKYYDGTSNKEVNCVSTDDATGNSSLIALKIGLDAFHGISPKETSAIIKSYLPDLNAPGAVKTGEAELVAGVVLKNTKMAGILNDIKIQPTE